MEKNLVYSHSCTNILRQLSRAAYMALVDRTLLFLAGINTASSSYSFNPGRSLGVLNSIPGTTTPLFSLLLNREANTGRGGLHLHAVRSPPILGNLHDLITWTLPTRGGELIINILRLTALTLPIVQSLTPTINLPHAPYLSPNRSAINLPYITRNEVRPEYFRTYFTYHYVSVTAYVRLP